MTYDVIVEQTQRWRVEVRARSEEEAKRLASALLTEDGADLDAEASIPELLAEEETVTVRPKQ